MTSVTIITATTGNPLLARCIASVRKQTYKNIQHIVVVDGQDRWDAADSILYKLQFPVKANNEQLCVLPYATGINKYNGHRIYGGFTYIADGDCIMYLDEDNYLEPNHVESCVLAMQNNEWTYSLRNIVDKDSNFICQDNCESLGKWASVIHPEDFFVDVNCFFMPKPLAVHLSPIWNRKAREPNVPEVDRVLTHFIKQVAPRFDSTYQYTVNYTAGNTEVSVQKEFFIQGNERMLAAYQGNLPWQK